MGEDIKTTAELVEAAALPRVHVTHTDTDTPNKAVSLPNSVTKKPVAQKSPAEWAYERLILYIKNFEEQLDNAHEVAMGFTGGDAGVVRIESIGFFDPDIVTFYGSDPTGTKTQLIQHVTQLNVMLRALPKQVADAEPNRIGFRICHLF